MPVDLWSVAKTLDEDYAPYGKIDRETALDGDWGPDCSMGCRFFLKLEGELGNDWGVCSNPKSHRAGLLTWEHSGCVEFRAARDEESEEETDPA